MSAKEKQTSNMGNTLSQISNAAFKHLPKELRLLIWEKILNDYEPAFVVLEPEFGDADNELFLNPFYPERGDYMTRASRGVPELMTTSDEARGVALKRYRLMFGAIDNPSSPKYFDIDKDGLHLRGCGPRWEDAVAYWPEVLEELALIKHLVAYNPPAPFTHHYVYKLIAYKSLETLSIPAAEVNLVSGYEALLRRAMAHFWTTQMNPRQIASGRPVTAPPRIIFLTQSEVQAFYNRVPERSWEN
jgi:hypothetical protein